MPSPSFKGTRGSGGNAQRDFTSYLGMVVGLVTFGMLFAALFFAYGVVRIDAAVWPPAGEEPLPLTLPLINTLVIALSSLTVHMAVRTLRQWPRLASAPEAGSLPSLASIGTPFAMRAVHVWRWIAATMVLGAVFLTLQTIVWRGVWARGLRPSSGIYGSVFYALTVIHAVHVVAGLVALLAVLIPALRGEYRKNKHTPLRLVGMFWHFVDAVWILMFFAVYVF